MNGSVFWRNGMGDVKAWFGLLYVELEQETTSTLIIHDVSLYSYFVIKYYIYTLSNIMNMLY